MKGPGQQGLRVVGANAVIFLYLSLACIDAIPLPGGQGNLLKRFSDPLLDFTGTWQGTWDLFAPSVDKENHRISAEIFVAGSSEPLVWNSPDWSKMNCLDLFRHSREIEFYDRIRSNWNEPAQASFCDYLKRIHERNHTDGRVSAVQLISTQKRIRMGKSEPEVTVNQFYRRDYPDD